MDAAEMEEGHREHALLELLEANVAPALNDLSSLDGIGSYNRAARLDGFLVRRSARRVLNALNA